MTSSQWRKATINTLGTLGYISGILQWTWTLIILGYPLLTADHVIFFPKPTHVVPITSGESVAFSPVLLVAAIASTLLVLAFTVVTLIKLPKSIGISGAKTTHTVAKAIIPAVTHHKKLPKKQYVALSYRIIITLKYLLTILPLVLLVFAPTIAELSQKIILTVGAGAAIFTLFYFTAQALLVEMLRIDKKSVW